MYLTWQAHVFGITKRRAFLMAFFLCCAVLMFPWVLQTGRTIWWILLVIFLVMIGIFWPKIQLTKGKSRNDRITTEQKVNSILDDTEEIQEDLECTEEIEVDQECTEEIEVDLECTEEIEVNLEYTEEIEEDLEHTEQIEEDLEYTEEIQEDQGCFGDNNRDVLIENDTVVIKNLTDNTSKIDTYPGVLGDLLSLEELIDLGFKAKHTENFEQAASYFYRALYLEPMPDLAFYLILDCYWLWNNLGERNYALTQLDKYVKTYLPLFNSDLRHKFDTWMTRENIDKNFI